ncbi:MAG: hypothetical protein M1825_002785 [Sarcosagium campestre]|nr:MAG: hypothetical protein M1825_002785 [Sarcosagium campestre]
MEDNVEVPLIVSPTVTASPVSSPRQSNDSEHAAAVRTEELGHSPGLFVWTLTLTAGISGLLFGYDTGVISATLVTIKSDLSNRPLSTLDKSLITSCTSFFALLASPLTGFLADSIGRKKAILLADLFFIVGSLWQALSTSVFAMVCGRSIVGVAVGAASLVVPL